MRAAALIYGPQGHHLDHLAPICHLLEIPLIVTEEQIKLLAEKFYPGLKVEFVDCIALPEYVVVGYETIFSSMPRPLFDEIFFFAETFHRKKLHTIWCPHGNSDKGRSSPFMEALKSEKTALLYGKRMIDFLKEKEVFNQLKASVVTGNYRYAFYKKHKSFFDPLIPFQKGKRTILYAPTWQDYESSSSFFAAAPFLLEKLPEDLSLLVKLHPNLLLENDLEIQKWIWKYESCENIHFLTDFPLVYPLLDFVDIYLGDASSIGYDFLTFHKPMFFLNQNGQNSYLHKCGTVIDTVDYKEIYPIIEKKLPQDFRETQKAVYEETFGEEKSLPKLKEEILNLCENL